MVPITRFNGNRIVKVKIPSSIVHCYNCSRVVILWKKCSKLRRDPHSIPWRVPGLCSIK